VRFVVEFMDISDVPPDGGYPSNPGPEDTWILARLGETSREVDRLLDEYRLSDAFAVLYNFAWSEVFDWYVEMAKSIDETDSERYAAMQATLGTVTRDALKLFHPVMPFVTEELWSHLGDDSTLLITAPWPDVPAYGAPKEMASLQGIVAGIRQFRSQHQIPRRAEMPVIVATPNGVDLPSWWFTQVASLTSSTPRSGQQPDPVTGYTRLSSDGVEGFIALAGLIDVDAERPRIEKAISELEASIARSRSKLDNPNFRDRAPAEVVAQEEGRMTVQLHELDKQRSQLAELG
jgi:valyl-tRNA synthetase